MRTFHEPDQHESYADIRRTFDKAKPWRNSNDRPWAQRTHRHKHMKLLGDGSVQVWYKGTDFVTWHPDGTITLKPFDGVQQPHVWSHMMPASIFFEEQVRVGMTVMLAPRAQVRRGYRYNMFPYFISRSGVDDPCWGDRKVNPDVKVIRQNFFGRRFRLDEKLDMWRPVDAENLDHFEWQELDKSAARKVAEASGLRDFEAFLRALTTLDADSLAPFEHENMGLLMDLIEQRDFAGAMALFPRGEGWRRHRYYYNAQKSSDGLPPTWSYFGHLRTRLYKRSGVLVERSQQVLTLPEYERVRGLLYRFQ